MELLVGCALGVVAFSTYVTLRDVLNDLKPRRSPVRVRIRRAEMESRLYRAHLYHD